VKVQQAPTVQHQDPPLRHGGHAKPQSPKPTAQPYNPDAIHLTTDRKAAMQMVVTATGANLGFKTPKAEAGYLKSLDMAQPVSEYDPKGFLASLGLWGIVGAGRNDQCFAVAVKDSDYKPHFGTDKISIPIPGFIMKGLVNNSKSYVAVQGIVDPLLAAYTNKRGIWKKPFDPAQDAKPTSTTPQQRYADALSGQPSIADWGSDFHNGEGEHGAGYGTFQIATGMGFGLEQARHLAGMSDGVDTNKTPYGKTSPIVIGQMDRHFNFDRDGEDTRILWARRHLEEAIKLGRLGSFDEAEIELGVGLHSLQDIFAHGQVKPTAHATLGKFVDDPLWSPVSMVEATVATRNYLKAYLKGITNADGSYNLPPEPVKP
jgi:hypothetical protein